MTDYLSKVAVEVKDLRKAFGPTMAVDGISFDVRYGEVVGFIGVNGAGKTTTLKMILGLLRPTSGTIQVDGQAVGSKQSLANIGVLSEQPAFYDAHSGRKNLKILLRGAQKGFTQKSLNDDLGRVDLGADADRRTREFSKGMRTRLGLAHVLARRGRIYVFDEPGTGLDPIGISFVRDLMRSLADGGGAVLFSSHILSEVESISDRVVMIHKGKMLAFDTLENVRHIGLDKERFNVVVPHVNQEQATKLLQSKFGGVVENDEGNLVVPADSGGEINRALFDAGIVAESIGTNANPLDAIFRGLVKDDSEEAT